MKDYWMSISGFFSENEGQKLQELAQGKVCIEIGSYLGRSTTCMAAVAKKVYAVDTHKSWEEGQKQREEFSTLHDFLGVIRDFTNIIPLIGRSVELSKELDNNVADLLFIDSFHTYEEVKADTLGWWHCLKVGGIICYHDYGTWPGVALAVDELFKEYKKEVVDSFCWFSKIRNEI